MCEKCEYQSKPDGYCQNVNSPNYRDVCPGIEMKADVRECDFSIVLPCKDNTCQKCER